MLRGSMDSSRTRRAQQRAISAVLVLGASTVFAANAPQQLPVDIIYRTDGTNCPSRDEFVAAVREALAASGAQLSRDERQFTVSLEDGRGTLEVGHQAGVATSHEVHGSSCSEVGSALALSLALAIAPGAAAESAVADDSSTNSALPPAAPTSSAPRAPQWAMGLGVIGMNGPTPFALGGAVFLDFPHGNGRFVAPQLRLWAAYLGTVAPYEFSLAAAEPAVPVAATSVRVHWQWYLVRVELCGLHLTAVNYDYGLRLCADIDAGMIVSHPVLLQNTESNRRPWLASGLGPRAFWEAFGVEFEVAAGVSFPLTRYRYFLDDYRGGVSNFSATDVYQVQPVGWTFSMGAVYELP